MYVYVLYKLMYFYVLCHKYITAIVLIYLHRILTLTILLTPTVTGFESHPHFIKN